MSKPRASVDLTIRVTFLVLLAVLTLVFGLLFLLVFVPVVGWYLWKFHERIKRLEGRVAPSEAAPKKPAEE